MMPNQDPPEAGDSLSMGPTGATTPATRNRFRRNRLTGNWERLMSLPRAALTRVASRPGEHESRWTAKKSANR